MPLLDLARRIAHYGSGEFRADLRRLPSWPALGGKGDQVLGALSVTHSEGCSWDTDRSERDRMTRGKHLKRLVRSRAAATGESYAAALRSIRQRRPEDPMPGTATSADAPVASCSFCDKPNTAVKTLVAGHGAFICNECVELSAAIVAEAARATPQERAELRERSAGRSADEILTMLPGAARSASRIEAELARWVTRLREQGTGWQRIADALGTSTDAARQRFEERQPG